MTHEGVLNGTPSPLNLCINDADVRRLSGDAMTNVGANNRASRSDLPARAVQDPPVLIKRAQTKWPKWVLQLAHKVNFRLCKVPPEVRPLLKALSRNKIDCDEVIRELLYSVNGQAPPLNVSDLQKLDQFQLYRLYKTLKSNGAMFEALAECAEDFTVLSSIHGNLSKIWDQLLRLLSARGVSVSYKWESVDPGRKEQLSASLRAFPKSALLDPIAVKTRFMLEGEVDARIMVDLLKDIYLKLGLDDRDGGIEAQVLIFHKAGTISRKRFLDGVLWVFKNHLRPDAKTYLLNLQRALFKYGGDDDKLDIQHLPGIWPVDLAMWALHDIARQFASANDPKELKEAVKNELRIFEVDKSAAKNFRDLANRVVVGGRSAVVRDAIGEYAVEPTRPRPKTWS